MTTVSMVAAACLLEGAAEHVEQGWAQDANARKADGTGCSPESPEAVCWCANGGLHKASHELGIWTHRDGRCVYGEMPHADYEYRRQIMNKARSALVAVIERTHPKVASIVTWNDKVAKCGLQVGNYLRTAAGEIRIAAGSLSQCQ